MNARSIFVYALLPAVVAFRPLRALPQVAAISPPAPRSTAASKQQLHVAGRITAVTGEPVVHAQVEVDLGAGPNPVTALEANLKGEFEADYSLDLVLYKGRRLSVVAMKDGYAEAFEAADFASVGDNWRVDLVMREEEEKPDQLPLAQLTSNLTRRFRGGWSGAPPFDPRSADTLRAALQFLEKGDAAGAAPILAKVVEREAGCVECRTLLGLAMLGRGSWSSALEQLTQAANLSAPDKSKPRRGEPFLILGVIENWRKDATKAADLLLQALNADPLDPLALQEFGRSLILQHNWTEADKCLTKAIQAGASAEAHLLKARALLSEGNPQQAQAEMNTYLGGRSAKDLPIAVRSMWSEMVERLEWESNERPKSVVDQTAAELVRTLPDLKGIEPAASQDQLPDTLRRVGEGVRAFFSQFPNTSSLEEIHEERLQRTGKVAQSLNQAFQYLCFASPERTGLGFAEYRTERSGLLSGPRGLEQGFMLTSGFASASLPFHPVYQPDSAFRYLGRQMVEGREAFVIAYAQRPEAARLTGAFRVNESSVTTLSQGLAWIDPANYQIIRMRTDLLNPCPKVALQRETTDIRFGKVHFKEISADLWLPLDVTVTVEWRGRILRNRHNYSEFKIFNVETQQKGAKVLLSETEADR
jgi:tetratricopeptide (TPR) repeat protein